MKRKIQILSPPDMVDDVLFDMVYSIRNIPAGEHLHDCIEIGITYGGCAIHVAGGITEQLQRGDVFIILPGSSHTLEKCEEFEHITISCSPEILTRIGINLSFIHGVRDLFATPGNAVSFHLSSTEFNDAKRLIDSMLEAYDRDKKGENGNLRSYFSMLICLFAQSYSLHHKNSSVFGRLDNAVAYMNDQFKKQISLPKIAAIANLSVSQFGRVFKRNYGTTPIYYILELRLNESRRLLKYSQLDISEIAYLVGFHDTNYFSRQFKKHFKITPSQAKISIPIG